jgi:hypothetical protein
MEKNFYRDPMTGKVLPERRTGVDRRTPSTVFRIFAGRFRRRASKGRRKTDPGAYVDVYDPRSWYIAVTVLVLSCLDALMTGLHMTKGSATELNPVMNIVLIYGGLPAFFGAKVILTVFPMAVILVHKEWSLGRFAARLCLWSYVLIFFYHLYLISAVKFG